MKISKDLRESIADAAIHGKLVEQNKAEGTASELLNKLSLHSAFDEDTDIPESWTFIRLENATVKKIARGKSPKYVENSSIMAFAQKCNLKAGGISLEQAKYWDEEKANKYKDEEFLHDNDIVINSTGGGTLGRVGQFHSDMLPEGIRIIPDSHVTTIRINPEFDYRYFYIYLKFNQPWLEIMGVGSTNQTELKPQVLKDMIVPLPPVAEQKRIVEKYYKLMKEIDELEKKENELEKLKTEFPEDMKESLLQAAMQGKLTEQTESNAKEEYEYITNLHKPIQKCNQTLIFDDFNTDLPRNWCVAELNNIVNFVDYRGKTPHKVNSGVFLITASNIKKGYMDYTRKEYISNEEYSERQSRGITHEGDLLFTTEAPLGNAAICDLSECSCGQRIITFQEYEKNTINLKYLMYVLLSPLFQKELKDNCTGTTAKGIKAVKLKHLLIPFPPFEEQERIVAKLDELLPLCEGLKES